MLKSLTMDLAEWPEGRTALDGARTLLLRGREVGGRGGEVRALARGPLAAEIEGRMADLETPAGIRVSLEGTWRKRGWTDRGGARREQWEFLASAAAVRLPGEAEGTGPVVPEGGEPRLARYGGLDLPAEPFGETPALPSLGLSGFQRLAADGRRRREMEPEVRRIAGEALGLAGLAGPPSGEDLEGTLGDALERRLRRDAVTAAVRQAVARRESAEGPALARDLAALWWAVGVSPDQDRQVRLVAQSGVLAAAREFGVEEDFRREVRTAGLAGAREDAVRPELRGLLDAAVRGDDAAQARVLARNPELGRAVAAARRLPGAPSARLEQALAGRGQEGAREAL